MNSLALLPTGLRAQELEITAPESCLLPHLLTLQRMVSQNGGQAWLEAGCLGPSPRSVTDFDHTKSFLLSAS